MPRVPLCFSVIPRGVVTGRKNSWLGFVGNFTFFKFFRYEPHDENSLNLDCVVSILGAKLGVIGTGFT